MKLAAFYGSLLVLLGSGWLHARWSEGLGSSEQLTQFIERVPVVPLRIGDWQATPVEGDERAFASAGARSYWMRMYTHERTGASMLVILMAGPAGRMAVHTPEVCYGGAGFRIFEGPNSLPISWDNIYKGDVETDQFWTARFRKQASVPTDLKLIWGWNAHGKWEAPVNPRFHFRGERALYKLYLVQDQALPAHAGKMGDEAALDFMKQLLPELKKDLFPS